MTECGFKSNRVLPAVYGDELSYYEQLNKLCMEMNKLIEAYEKQVKTYATIEMLEKSQNAQNAEWTAKLKEQYSVIMDYTKGEVRRLEKLIEEATTGKVLVFDPTYGIAPRPVEQVIKNVYHWLRYFADYAVTIDNLNLTANVRDDYQIIAKDFDLYSMLFYSHSENPQPSPVDQYVKKHDILAYYFDRMEA